MRVVIVGGGIVAGYIAKRLSEIDSIDILILSKESFPPYDRIHLCALLDGSKCIEDISLELPSSVKLEQNQEITSIDKEAKKVYSATSAFSYDKLIIATGSKPKSLLECDDVTNATTFRSADDSVKIGQNIEGKNVILMGVGPIGIELLDTLSKMDKAKNIYLVSRGEHIYSKDLDSKLITFMKDTFEKNPKVHILFNEEMVDTEIVGDKITKAFMKNQIIEDPFVIFGVGISPNIEFARDTLKCNKGILVDNFMRADEDIYAIGESAELADGYIAGRVKECTIECDSAISHIVGESPVEFIKPVAIDGLKIGSLLLADVSSPEYRENDKESEGIIISSRKDNRYDQYILKNDKLTRFIGINTNIDLMALQELIKKDKPIDASFLYQNRLESERGKLVCSCTGTYLLDIVDTVKENAITSFSELKPHCEAGRVCGRCKEDIVNIIAATPIDPAEAARIKAAKEAAARAEEEGRIKAKIDKYNALHPKHQIDTTDLNEALKSFELQKDYNRWISQITANLRLHPTQENQVREGVEALSKIPIIWLELSDCTGNSEAFIKSANPTVDDLILKYISLDYHELLMAPSGDNSESQLESIIKNEKGKYILLVEGAVPMAMDGKYLRIGPKGETGIELLRKAAEGALAIMSIGSCAFDGGVVAAEPNPTGAVGVSEALGRDDIINLPGCPVNPINIVGTLLNFLMFEELPKLDSKNRPLWAYSQRVHDNCERRGHYDLDEFVLEWGDEGAKKGWCLFQMGCKGPYADINCSVVKFNEGTSWPVQVGHGCFGCGQGKLAFDKYANNRPLPVEE